MTLKLDTRNARRKHAFTLIELLACIAILGLLSSLVIAGVQSALAAAARTREVAAARTLICAYLQTPLDNQGKYLAGYDRSVGELQWKDGTAITGPVASRYPFRLAPFFDYRMEGTILVNDNARQVSMEDSYLVSLCPAFGINYLYVGGEVASDGALTFPLDCVAMTSQSASILVFATAAFRSSGNVVSGYCLLTPPQKYSSHWANAPWTPQANPAAYGNLDPRHGGKVLCAFLDGSVRHHSVEELRDMRLWNSVALHSNNPNYTIPIPTPPPRR